MTSEELRMIWEKEESIAQIKGWDFSHIHGRGKAPASGNRFARVLGRFARSLQ